MNIAPNLQPISSRSLDIHRPIQLLIGVTILISANNLSGGPNLAVVFDTRETGTRDSDLEDASSLGNIGSYEVLGMLLMIQEISVEFELGGSRPLGNIVISALQSPVYLSCLALVSPPWVWRIAENKKLSDCHALNWQLPPPLPRLHHNFLR
ncbi:MAG: hypothetical protein VX745_11405 [Pseudomonadota bacterium]|nr:hypothetical protein [Pseudomonadota bacterium]